MFAYTLASNLCSEATLFEDCGLAGANALLYEIVIKFVKKIDYFLCENNSHIKMLTFSR